MSRARTVFLQALQYGSGSGLALLASLISYPLLTRLFSQSDYGLMALISSTVFGFVALGKMGLQHAAVRFYPEQRTREEQVRLRSSLVMAPFVTGTAAVLLISVVAILLENRAFDRSVTLVVFLASPLIVLEAVKALLLNFMRAEHRSLSFAVASTLDKYGILAFSVGIVIIWRRDLISFYAGWLLWNAMLTGSLLLQTFRRREVAPGLASSSVVREALRFGAPLLFFEFGNMLLTYGDRYLVAHFLGSERTGIYAAAYNLSVSIQTMLLVPLTSIIFPWASKLWSEHGREDTERFASRILNYFLIVTVPIIFGAAVLAKPIMVTLASAKYAESASLLTPLMAATVLFGLYHVLALGLFIQKKTVMLAVQVLAATLANVLLNLWMIPRFGLMGAALSTVLGYALLLAFAWRQSLPLLNVRVDIGGFLRVLFSSAMMALVVSVLPGDGAVKLLLGLIVGATVYSTLILLIDRNLRNFVRTLMTHQRPVEELL